ncbi:MAG: 50S ribosomal protein L32e [Candidatus Hadarchaeia archaeon]
MTKDEFKRQGVSRYKRVKKSWRKPKGGDSKMRKECKGRPKLVKVGRKKPESERGIHPSGYKEILVHNPDEVGGVDSESEAIRIASEVGERKKEGILEVALENDIKVLNADKRRIENESGEPEENGS